MLEAGWYLTNVNLYYLLAFPLTAVLALWALRRFGVALPLAVALAVLYAFLPFRRRAARKMTGAPTRRQVARALVERGVPVTRTRAAAPDLPAVASL